MLKTLHRFLLGMLTLAASPLPAAATTAPAVFPGTENRALTQLAKKVFVQMQSDHVDKSLFSNRARAALDDEQLATAALQLQALGDPAWSYEGEFHAPGGEQPQLYDLTFNAVKLRLEVGFGTDRKLTNFFLSPIEDKG